MQIRSRKLREGSLYLAQATVIDLNAEGLVLRVASGEFIEEVRASEVRPLPPFTGRPAIVLRGKTQGAKVFAREQRDDGLWLVVDEESGLPSLVAASDLALSE